MSKAQLLAVAVRAGFVVHYVDKVKQGDKIVDREQFHYPEDGPVELPPNRVKEHAHKLEPADKASADFLAKLAVEVMPPAAGPAIDVQGIATAAAIAAVQAMQATQAQSKPAA